MTVQLILILISLYIIYNIYNTIKPKTIAYCKVSNSNPSCKMYNSRDINTKCSAMCVLEHPESSYNGKYELKGDIHICECKTKNKEKFMSIKQSTINKPILGEKIKSDSLFSNRNYVEKVQGDRLKSLIFG